VSKIDSFACNDDSLIDLVTADEAFQPAEDSECSMIDSERFSRSRESESTTFGPEVALLCLFLRFFGLQARFLRTEVVFPRAHTHNSSTV